MRAIISKAASVALLFYSSQLNESQFAQAIQIQSMDEMKAIIQQTDVQIPEPHEFVGTNVQETQQVDHRHKSKGKNGELEHLMQNKQQELQKRIEGDEHNVKNLEVSLLNAKIELETDQTMLFRHKKVLEEEKAQLALLEKKVGARAQAIDKIELKKQKHQKLKAAADRLVQKESEVRAKVLKEITQKVQAEVEAARRTGQMEAKDDQEIIRRAKEEALKKAEQMDIEEENNQINKLSNDLSKKSNKLEPEIPQHAAQKEEAYPPMPKPQPIAKPEQKHEQKHAQQQSHPKSAELKQEQKKPAQHQVNLKTNEKPKEMVKAPAQAKHVTSKVETHKAQNTTAPAAHKKVQGKDDAATKAPAKEEAKDATKDAAKEQPAADKKAEAAAGATGTVVAKAKASDDDMFAEMKEMNSFGTEEDKALAGQLDGEALVKSIGTVLGRDVSKEVKNATPGWVTGKWFKKQGMEGAGDIE